MDPVELAARRRALGLSQRALGRYLRVTQVAVSRWETGERPIPGEVANELALLEDQLADLADAITESALAGPPGAVIIAHASDESLASAHPEMGGLPAELHQVACAWAQAALRDEGLDVRIVGAEKISPRS